MLKPTLLLTLVVSAAPALAEVQCNLVNTIYAYGASADAEASRTYNENLARGFALVREIKHGHYVTKTSEAKTFEPDPLNRGGVVSLVATLGATKARVVFTQGTYYAFVQPNGVGNEDAAQISASGALGWGGTMSLQIPSVDGLSQVDVVCTSTSLTTRLYQHVQQMISKYRGS